MNRVPDRPNYDHPDVCGETQAWCATCQNNAENCEGHDDFVRSSANAEANQRKGQAQQLEAHYGLD